MVIKRSTLLWVTGASSGIGEALAKALAREGAGVILSGRRVSELQRVASETDGKTLVLPFDVAGHATLPEVVSTAWNWVGAVDVLINNAGGSQSSLALQTHLDVYRQLIEVNYLAPMQLTQLLLPRMIDEGGGHVAVVSAVAGKVGTPLQSGYSAAKHAVIGYFDALRAEVEAAYGIKVSVILPGSVATAEGSNALTSDGSPRGNVGYKIEGGMAVEIAAEAMIRGLSEARREIRVAEGIELKALSLRTEDPEFLFAMLAQEGKVSHSSRLSVASAIIVP